MGGGLLDRVGSSQGSVGRQMYILMTYPYRWSGRFTFRVSLING